MVQHLTRLSEGQHARARFKDSGFRGSLSLGSTHSKGGSGVGGRHQIALGCGTIVFFGGCFASLPSRGYFPGPCRRGTLMGMSGGGRTWGVTSLPLASAQPRFTEKMAGNRFDDAHIRFR